jgi:hypothetical protein
MKQLLSCLFIVISLLLIPISSFGEPPKLFVGGVVLKLGMTEKEVKEKFAMSNTGYQLENTGNKGYDIVSKKGPPYELAGGISFDDKGKLFWIGKDWGNYFGSGAYSLGRAIYNCFTNQQQPSKISFQTYTRGEPGYISYDVVIFFSNGKQIAISTSERKGRENQVYLQESLLKK